MTSKGVKTRSAVCEYDAVDVEELHIAEQEITRHVQKESFKDEISKLKNLKHKILDLSTELIR